MPLLIGGATTSRVHTAVKIAPNYANGPTVYVPDASRAVGVVTSLLSEDQRASYVAQVSDDYATIRAQHAGKRGPKLVTLATARANAFKADWRGYAPTVPSFIGRRVFRNVDLAGISECIDWGPFFQAWELAVPFPAILDDPIVGEAARTLFTEGKAMLAQIVDGRWLEADGVVGLWPAASRGDDIVMWTDETRTTPLLDVAQPAPAERAARGKVEPLPGGLRRARGFGHARLRGGVRRDHRRRCRRPCGGVQACKRRLFGADAEVARRSPGRSVC